MTDLPQSGQPQPEPPYDPTQPALYPPAQTPGPARRRKWWPWVALAAVSLVVYGSVSAVAAITGADEDAKPAKPVAAASASPTPAATTPAPDQDGDGTPDSSDAYPADPANRPSQTVLLACDLDDSYMNKRSFQVVANPDNGPDFTAMQAAKPISCDADPVSPVTALEKTAYKTSGYDDNNISTLYTICGAVDPGDVYASAGFAASDTQIPEINGALTLCPKHPQGGKWRQAVQRGKAEVKLQAQGRLFGSGTFLVGREIKAGTYVATNVEGCYWERQNKSGGTIDNYFTISAKRVQVTIKSSDYAFHSESCGEWRPR